MRICAIEVKRKLGIIYVYGPAQTTNSDLIHQFYEILYKYYYYMLDMKLKIICCGDFNAHLDSCIPYQINLPGIFLKSFIENTQL